MPAIAAGFPPMLRRIQGALDRRVEETAQKQRRSIGDAISRDCPFLMQKYHNGAPVQRTIRCPTRAVCAYAAHRDES